MGYERTGRYGGDYRDSRDYRDRGESWRDRDDHRARGSRDDERGDRRPSSYDDDRGFFADSMRLALPSYPAGCTPQLASFSRLSLRPRGSASQYAS
ncbi:MAG: hypothetical protein EOO77_38375 [Oxalobacteraceae bacterium]|nr:MAG: hypothetical protein EOO77_38375 [Oxalobacteraceae bacterium]